MSKDYFTTASSTNQETPPVTLNYLQETIDSLKRTLQPPPSPLTIVTGNNCSRLWKLAKIQEAQSGILPQGGAPVYTSEVLPDEFMGHVWYTNRDMEWNGYEEEPAYIETEDSFCAGYQCNVCGYWFCIHCHPDGPPEPCEGERNGQYQGNSIRKHYRVLQSGGATP